jgi:hypothetical protein
MTAESKIINLDEKPHLEQALYELQMGAGDLLADPSAQHVEFRYSRHMIELLALEMGWIEPAHLS